jgi:hypothetical protein
MDQDYPELNTGNNDNPLFDLTHQKTSKPFPKVPPRSLQSNCAPLQSSHSPLGFSAMEDLEPGSVTKAPPCVPMVGGLLSSKSAGAIFVLCFATGSELEGIHAQRWSNAPKGRGFLH